MNNTIKGIIVVIVAANLIYFIFGGMSGDGSRDQDCEQALAEFNISEHQLDCDFICEQSEAVNAQKGGGPPDLEKVKALTTLNKCIEERTGSSCTCPDAGD
jgi:hypothetical protein